MFKFMTDLYITKRDGREVKFDAEKIKAAVARANTEVTTREKLSRSQINAVAEMVERTVRRQGEKVSVEDIQNMVEVAIMEVRGYEVAQKYVRFRYKKEVARESRSDFFDAIGEKLRAENVENQNANLDERSFSGRVGEATRVLTKDYAMRNIISPMARENHENNEIYIHDLDSYAAGMHNCLSLPIDDLLEKGFNTRQTDVRPANSVNTAMQLVAVLFQLQSLQQFGGVSATHLDHSLVPYVRKSFSRTTATVQSIFWTKSSH